MLEHYLAAFGTIFLPQNILAMSWGALGIIAGALRGSAPPWGVVLLIPFTFALSPITAFTILVSAYCGGSPGIDHLCPLRDSGRAIRRMHGHRRHALAKQGHAARALWIFIIASAIGGFSASLS